MASGSHTWRMNWPDFDMTAAISEHEATSSTRWLISPLTAISLISRMLKVWPAPKKRMITPQIRPTSPTRLVMKALRAASEFGFSSHQWPMSANEQRPDQLPAGEELERALAHDQPEHRGGEQRQEREVVRVAPVAAHVVGAVHVHEQRDQRDDEEHHHGGAVEEHAGGELDAAARPPRPRLLDGRDLELGRAPPRRLLGRRPRRRRRPRPRRPRPRRPPPRARPPRPRGPPPRRARSR